MPLYEYHCKECGLTFERFVRGRQKGDTHVCRCGAQASRRLSRFGVSVKGAGFRKTEHATVDERIGADADQRREYYKSRHEEKRKLQEANPGKKIALKEDRSFVVVDG